MLYLLLGPKCLRTGLGANILRSKSAGGDFNLDESCWSNPNLETWPEPQSVSLPDTANSFYICLSALSHFHQPAWLCQNIIFPYCWTAAKLWLTHTHTELSIIIMIVSCVLGNTVRPRLCTLTCMNKDLFPSGTVLHSYPKIGRAISYWRWD